jgi:oligopeptide/dipeptide ABC transporter ATP-binding protein
MTMTELRAPDTHTDPRSPLLVVRDLRVGFGPAGHETLVIRGVDLDVPRGEMVGLVGESGSGKSVTGRAIMGLLNPRRTRVDAAVMTLDGQQLIDGPRRSNARMAMIFQNPFTSLDPVFTVGDFLCEVLRRNQNLRGRAARSAAVELLESVRIPQATARLRAYPHELSGGQQQRVVIAVALAQQPMLLIADEPTTALDVTVQAEIVGLLSDIQVERNMSIIFISHDLALVSDLAERVYVMYAGKIVEDGPSTVIQGAARHPYTRGLMAAAPSPHTRLPRLTTIPGSPPVNGDFASGCAFRPRCPLSTEECAVVVPPRLDLGPAHGAACLHADHGQEAFA